MPNSIYGTSGADIINGTSGEDHIYAGDGNDRINGSPGADRLFGENGDDLFVFSVTGYSPGTGLIDGGSGYDRVDVSNVDSPFVFLEWDDIYQNIYIDNQAYALAGIEEVQLGNGNDFSGDYWGTSTVSSDFSIYLGGGDDFADLRGSVDIYGETGDDWFNLFSNPTSAVVTTNGLVDGGAGFDTVRLTNGFTVDLARGFANHSDSRYALAQIEHIEGVASSNPMNSSRIYGDGGDNSITVWADSTTANDLGVIYRGRGGADFLEGSNGRDELFGDTGNDTLWSGTGNDRLLGGEGDDVLNGGDGMDSLNGGAGIDQMAGGTDNDQYYLDTSADVVIEVANEGIDAVFAGFHYALGANVENLRLLAGNWNGTGNALDNTLFGSAGGNTLRGLGGDDRLFGEGGPDILSGGAGNDRLFGGVGRDTMTGGAGAYRFVFEGVEDLGTTYSSADVITDFNGGAGDRIYLNGIDAIEGTTENEAFSFIGTEAFSGTAGELRTFSNRNGTFIEMDTDGDGLSDMAILLQGQIDLVAGDFIL